MQLYMSWYIRSFFGFTFLNILYFFKYSCINIFHRRSLYTFHAFIHMHNWGDLFLPACRLIMFEGTYHPKQSLVKKLTPTMPMGRCGVVLLFCIPARIYNSLITQLSNVLPWLPWERARGLEVWPLHHQWNSAVFSVFIRGKCGRYQFSMFCHVNIICYLHPWLTMLWAKLLHRYFIHSLQWRHNARDGVSNYQPHDCLLNRLLRRKSKKISKLRVTGLCEFPAQRASNGENVSIWWRHHVDARHGQKFPTWTIKANDQVQVYDIGMSGCATTLGNSFAHPAINKTRPCCYLHEKMFISTDLTNIYGLESISSRL